MEALYSLGIYLYGAAIRIGALFIPKARRWIQGRKGLFGQLEKDLQTLTPERRSRVIWFHCASLGEFEQGRPLMERLREQYPRCVIAVTFFSPSGYDIRKNTPVADFVWYLPLDTPAHSRRFIRLLDPSLAFFVKYEYWFNLLRELRKRNKPVFIVSAVFRPRQLFFRWYGKWFLEQIRSISWFFLQNTEGKPLLEKHGIRNFTVTGDTRFDRVSAVAEESRDFPLVEKFVGDSRVMIGGSTWPEDEALLLPLIVNRKMPLKYIIAPHEVHESRIRSLVDSIRATPGMPVGQNAIVRLSELSRGNASRAKVLIVDSIGQLAYLYRYADFALVGGAFGSGLHNILEPVIYGKPVMFGPHHKKFPEAVELIRLGGAACVRHPEDLKKIVRLLLTDPVHRQHMSDVCRIFAASGKGSTGRILDSIRSFGFFPRSFSA